MEIAEEVAGCVAHLPVHVRQLAENSRPDRDISGVIHRAHPEPEHVRAVGRLLLLVLAALDDDHRVDDIAEGFAHLASLLVEREAVGQHRSVGSLAIDGNGGQQGRLEPAPMLIGAFQVEIRRVTEALPLIGDGGPA